MRKIRELGSLPSDAFEKYQDMGSKQVRVRQFQLVPGYNDSMTRCQHFIFIEA